MLGIDGIDTIAREVKNMTERNRKLLYRLKKSRRFFDR